MANGRLSIGLFCLEDILSLHEATGLVTQIVTELEGVVGVRSEREM